MPRGHRQLISLAVLALVGAAACAGSAAAPEAGQAATTAPATSPPTTKPTPAATATAEPEPSPITISFAGDVHFEAQLRSRLSDPSTALAPIATQLSAADLTVVNLETSIGESGTPEPKRYTFQAPAEALDALAAAGVDVATMANNHAMDFGPEGLSDTLAAIAADPPLRVIGVGSNAAQAFAARGRRCARDDGSRHRRTQRGRPDSRPDRALGRRRRHSRSGRCPGSRSAGRSRPGRQRDG